MNEKLDTQVAGGWGTPPVVSLTFLNMAKVAVWSLAQAGRVKRADYALEVT